MFVTLALSTFLILSGIFIRYLGKRHSLLKALNASLQRQLDLAQADRSRKEELASWTMEQRKGTPVMAISNEDEPPIFGTYVGTEVCQHQMGNLSRHHLVQSMLDGKTYNIMGFIIPTEHKELVSFLLGLSSKKQYTNGVKRPGKRWEVLISMTQLQGDLDLVYKHLPKRDQEV